MEDMEQLPEFKAEKTSEYLEYLSHQEQEILEASVGTKATRAVMAGFLLTTSLVFAEANEARADHDLGDISKEMILKEPMPSGLIGPNNFADEYFRQELSGHKETSYQIIKNGAEARLKEIEKIPEQSSPYVSMVKKKLQHVLKIAERKLKEAGQKNMSADITKDLELDTFIAAAAYALQKKFGILKK